MLTAGIRPQPYLSSRSLDLDPSVSLLLLPPLPLSSASTFSLPYASPTVPFSSLICYFFLLLFDLVSFSPPFGSSLPHPLRWLPPFCLNSSAVQFSRQPPRSFLHPTRFRLVPPAFSLGWFHLADVFDALLTPQPLLHDLVCFRCREFNPWWIGLSSRTTYDTSEPVSLPVLLKADNIRKIDLDSLSI